MKDLSIRCMESYLTKYPYFLSLQFCLVHLILQRFNAAFTFSIKFEAMFAEASSNAGIMRCCVGIRDLLTTNPWLVTDG